MADGDRTAQPTVVSRRWFCEVRGTRALHGSLRRGKFLASNGLCGMGTGVRGLRVDMDRLPLTRELRVARILLSTSA